MNTSISMKTETEKSSKKSMPMTLTATLVLLATFAVNPVIASVSKDVSVAPEKVDNVLIQTEKAIANLRIDPALSLESINQAMSAIKQLEQTYEYKVITKTKSKHNTEIAKGYEHFYPPLSQHMLDNFSALPTLSYKINTDILYKGEDGDLSNAYLDYTFAKASLMTAKDAINDNDALEAMANLRRVFEAIYLTPDFNVANS